MVLETKAGMESGVIGAGHRFAAKRLDGQRSTAGWLSEQMGGIAYLDFIRDLAKRVHSDWDSVQVAPHHPPPSFFHGLCLLAYVIRPLLPQLGVLRKMCLALRMCLKMCLALRIRVVLPLHLIPQFISVPAPAEGFLACVCSCYFYFILLFALGTYAGCF